MCELDIVPEALLFDVGNRRVSTDFIRFYEYFVRIRQTIPLPERPVVFEIGSGYGGLARIVKLHHPACALLLLDIEETLKGAGIYLRYAFPDAAIRYFTPANPRRPESGEIVLCRVEDSPALTGMTADITINTWSFGEMPNRHIDRWFRFLNDENTTRAIFLVNHFMMPVCLQSPTARAQLQSAQWLSRIDGRWDIVDFEMHPGSHRSPFWRHCQQGVCVAARLFESEAAKAEAVAAARAAVRDVYLEDWRNARSTRACPVSIQIVSAPPCCPLPRPTSATRQSSTWRKPRTSSASSRTTFASMSSLRSFGCGTTTGLVDRGRRCGSCGCCSI